ncbi:WD40-repeat-containing domain protein [Lipomyces chichibuensis]|uniref:WD40-repeat-containing domain protein n=1 Tax=Lipomyces chichibuensis TaxID=1546026 RepID=UPI00334323A8
MPRTIKPYEILAEWSYGIESDFALNGTPASWRIGQPVNWGDEDRKIDLDDNAYDCTVSADEKFLALGIGRQVCIYDLENLELIEVLDGHTEKIVKVEFFPVDTICNKYQLASARQNMDKLLVAVKEMVSRAVSDLLSGELTAFGSPRSTGTTLAPKIMIWDVEKGEKRLVLEGHTDSIIWVNASPDGEIVASVSWDQMVKLWDTSTGCLVHDIGPTGGQNWVGTFSPDSKYIAFTRGHHPRLSQKYRRMFLETVSVQWLDRKGLLLAFKGREGGVNVYDMLENQKWRSDPKKSDLINLRVFTGQAALRYLRKANQLISLDPDQTVRFGFVN